MTEDAAHDVDRPPHQGHGSFERPERGVRSKRDVFKSRQRMVELERLGMENVEAGVADVTALECLDERGLINQVRARGIDQDHALLGTSEMLGAEESRASPR